MSKKFKTGDKVIVKATGESGIVKSCDIVNLEDGKRVEVQYIVKLGEGFNNWKSFNKKELSKVETSENETYPKFYHRTYKDENNRQITLVGCVDKEWFTNNKTLSIGCAVLHPDEESNEIMGYKIARRRALERPMCSLESYLKGEFKPDTVGGIMDMKAKYIFTHIENFINK